MLRSPNDRHGRVGKLVLLGCGGLVVLVGGILALVFLLTGPQVKILEAHLAAMRSKNVEEAFKHVDGQHITKEQLKAILDLNPQVFGSSDVSFPSRRIATENGQTKAQVTANIKGTDGKEYTIDYILLPSGNDWKIAGFESKELAHAPAALTIEGVKTSQKKLDDGRTLLNIAFEVVGCGSRGNGAKFDYDLVLKGKLVDASGAAIVEEQEVEHFQESTESNAATVTRDYDFKIPSEVSGEVKATIIVEDKITGKGVSQVVPVKLDQ